jgi:hypothetical protein
MMLGTRIICDRCELSIGDDHITLGVDWPTANGGIDMRWIAHYHPACYAEIQDRIHDAADGLPAREPDSIDVLEAIPVATQGAISRLRRSHRLPDGSETDAEPAPAYVEPAPAWQRNKGSWRRLSQEERDTLVLNALRGRRLALMPLLGRIWEQHQDLYLTEAALRAQIKSMTDRGLVGSDTEKPPKGRSRTCWYVETKTTTGRRH